MNRNLFISVILSLVGLASQEPLAQSEPLSTANRVSRSAAGSSGVPLFSADGRWLVFVSDANNLIPNDDKAPFLDIFARDVLTGEIELISPKWSGAGGGNDHSFAPAVSSNGWRVLFLSDATNLVPNDANGECDVFLRDRGLQQTRLVTVSLDGQSALGPPSSHHKGAPLSTRPSISADGRWALFVSRATNLVALPDSNGAEDVFLRDLETETTALVSHTMGGTEAAHGVSDGATLSRDGRWIAFVSTATDILPGATNVSGDVFVHDRHLHRTLWASRDIPNPRPGRFRTATLGEDGGAVIFAIENIGQPGGLLFRFDLATETLIQIGTNTVLTETASLNRDATMVAYVSYASNPSDGLRIYLWRESSGTIDLVSRDPLGDVFHRAFFPSLSPDGTILTFNGVVQAPANVTQAGWQVYWRDIASQVTRAASVNSAGQLSRQPADPSPPALNPQNTSVAFASPADDLVAADLNAQSDVFLHDLLTGVTDLASARHPSLPGATASGPSLLRADSVSLEGRFVLFRSTATNITDRRPLTNFTRRADVMVRDRLLQTNIHVPVANLIGPCILAGNGRSVLFTGVTNGYRALLKQDIHGGPPELITARYDGTGAASGNSRNPSSSADGTLIAFESSSSDLVPNSGSGADAIFVRNLTTRSNTLVSVNRFGTSRGNGNSQEAKLSPDGRWVAFLSRASDLVLPAIPGGTNRVYARDLLQKRTLLLSQQAAIPLPGESSGVIISGNSQRAAYLQAGRSIYTYDLGGEINQLACTNCHEPALSMDGQWLAYRTFPNAEPSQCMLLNLENGALQTVSVNNGATRGGNGPSWAPRVSTQGRYVVFLSAASDLVPDDGNGRADLFLRDTHTHATLLLTPGTEDFAAGPNLFGRPIMALHGATVVFHSTAAGLLPEDRNGAADVFSLEIADTDADADGLDDGWEIVYFDDLRRDGSGDFDQDGQSDREEFLEGSNPIGNVKILTVTAVLRGEAGASLYWLAIPERSYRVEYKTDLEQTTWTPFPTVVTATGPSAGFLDPSASNAERRFYRVILQP